MLRAVTDALYDRLRGAFPANRAYGPDAFTLDPMPAPVAHFLTQTLQRRLDLDLEAVRSASSAWTDADHPDVQRAARALAEAFRRHGQVPMGEWEATLRQAVQRVTAYLVYPVETLADFVFSESDELPVETVRRRLSYFSAYPYLHTAVEAYLEHRAPAVLDRSRLVAVLERVDRQLTRDYDPEAWLGLLEPLGRLVRRAGLAEEGWPVALLRAFFQEKGAQAVAKRLTQQEQDGVKVVRPRELARLLADDEAPATKPEAAPRAAAAERAGTTPEPQAEGPVPLWKQFQQGGPAPRPAPAAPPPPPRTDDTPAARPTDAKGQPLWMRFRGGERTPGDGGPRRSAGAQDDGLDAVERSVLGPRAARNRALYLRHLFNDSPGAYRRVLQRLDETGTWPEASRIIAEEVFKKYQVNIYDEVAVRFTEAVEARYRREG